MQEMLTIDQMAQMGRDEICREVRELNERPRGYLRRLCSRKAQLDLNILLVLQPRLSLSIWVGRGAR
jgi:hypothetical protein